MAAFASGREPERILAAAPDLAVLDVMLPGDDGFALAQRLRAARDVAIVFLTARDGLDDRLAGFALGADDYLVKPFALEELLARVRAVLRRTGRLAGPLEAGDLLVDEAAAVATRAGRPLALTPTELRLLAFLIRHRGQVLSKYQLLSQVWGYEEYDPNLVEVHTSALRRKLEEGGARAAHPHGARHRLPPRAGVSTGSLRRRVTAAVLGLLLIVILGVRHGRHPDVPEEPRGRSAPPARGGRRSAAQLLGAGRRQAAGRRAAPRGHRRRGATARRPRAVACRRTSKPGVQSVKQQAASLLTLHVRVNDEVSATLTASNAGVDQDVRRLIEVEALVAVGDPLARESSPCGRSHGAALRPLDHVAMVAEGIAAGDVDRRLRPSRADTELGRMAAAFDRMVDALQEALDRSRTSEAATRQFLADASHELRTPIARLQATAETLLREQPARPDRDALEARLAGDAARLGRLVADLLDLARLDGAPARRRRRRRPAAGGAGRARRGRDGRRPRRRWTWQSGTTRRRCAAMPAR